MLAELENWLGNQKENLILWLPVFLGVGSAVYFGLKSEPSLLSILLIWVFCLAGVLAIFCFRQAMSFSWFLLALAVFITATGFGLAKLRTDAVYTPIILKETRSVMVEGDVVHTEILDGRKGTLLVLENIQIENFAIDKTPRKLRLTSKLRVRFNLGDRIQILAKLTPPAMPVMPGAYDFRRHYFFDGIGGLGFILKPPVIIKSANSTGELFLENLRKTIGDHIKKLLSSRVSGIVTALITGERAAIQEEDWDALRVSGLAHIISISGLHVVLIATPIFYFVRLFLAAFPSLALRYPIKKIAAIVALIGCSLYVALVVPTVPTYRALIMTGMGLLAIMMDRSPFSLRLISFAAIAVLLIAPESIWSASFQLSFAAVLSLIMAAEWTREYWSRWRNDAGHMRKFLLYLGGSIFTTLVVSIVTAPLAAYHFQQIPVYSVVANALIIPLSAIVIMPMTIATFLLWPFGAQDVALKIMAYGVEWMLVIAHETASWSGASLRLTAWPLSALICFVFSSLALFLLAGKARWVSSIGMLSGFILIVLNSQPWLVVSQSGNLLLIKDKQNIYLSSSMRDKFFKENWLKRLGKKEDDNFLFPKEGQIALSDGSITCGENMCRIMHQDQKISFGNDYYALKQDCDWADIIVTGSAFRDRSCKSKIYNKFTLQDTGAVQIDENGVAETVSQSLGIRPWSPINDRFGSGSIVRPEFERDRELEPWAYRRRSQAQE